MHEAPPIIIWTGPRWVVLGAELLGPFDCYTTFNVAADVLAAAV